MIGGFVRAHLETLTEADLDVLEPLMNVPDDDLADWLTGRCPMTTGDSMPMLRRIRAWLS
jgi:antitoxin CptB